MFKNLVINRPLAVIDLETTGKDTTLLAEPDSFST